MISDLFPFSAINLQDIRGNHPSWLSYVAFPFLSYFVWRFWSFTIRPTLRPQELDYLPYWVPFVGHAVSFFNNSNALYARGCSYFGNSMKPFILYVAGEKLAVISNPKHVHQIYKDTSSFSFDPFIDTLYSGVANVSSEGRTALWRSPKDGFKSLYPNPKQKVLVHTCSDLVHKQLLQPARLHDLIGTVLYEIERYTRWNSFFPSTILSSEGDARVVSAYRWCRDVLVDCQTQAFFGQYLRDIEPNFTTLMDAWDDNAWMMTYQYPPFLAKAAIEPRDKLIKALKQYFDTPVDERPTRSTVPLINEVEAEKKQGGLSTEDIARTLLMVLWGINANAPMLAFWMLGNLLKQPEVIDDIRKEIAFAMESIDELKDITGPTLAEMSKSQLIDKCPLLNSAFNEMTRVVSTGSTILEVKQPAVIDNKVLAKGTKVLMPQRLAHMSKSSFGDNADEIDFYRFLKDKSLERSEDYRPFGGGVTLCSGRVVGRHETLAFIAFILWRYDIQLVNEGAEVLGVKGKPFPRLDHGKPSLGISKQVEGDDIILKIAERKLR
ncbi:cytochrome P450 monooxygenase [Patellaria atrata CBS 101060]|uniref:Cytochrome P450 monooxygenase n=1 Tax=Patellaria atrata CBS 101060 TaxID=1346257 RepID=A0A9P4S7Z0_9PEZI|nr:cytochrome P450 monooxygenase [Patellaria atrata CBS 101060]